MTTPPVSYSRFPARVRLPDGRTLDKVAVVVTDGVARIYARADVVTAELHGVGAAENVHDAHTIRLTGADGTEWLVDQGTNCGCSGPLRRWFTTAVTHRGT